MGLLTVADFDQIRKAIDTDLTEEELPDEVIALPIYLGAAEAQVAARLPNVETLSGTALIAARNAIVYATAALLAPIFPQMRAASLGAYRYDVYALNPEKLAEVLRDKASSQMDMADTLGGTATVAKLPPIFVVAPGRRGR